MPQNASITHRARGLSTSSQLRAETLGFLPNEGISLISVLHGGKIVKCNLWVLKGNMPRMVVIVYCEREGSDRTEEYKGWPLSKCVSDHVV